MISLTSVSKSYPGQHKATAVLDLVNLRIGKGEFIYVVGDSGAGKTTLLKMLYGEEAPSRGKIEILGQDLSRADQGKLAALRRRMGLIFQDLRLVEELSAFDNVALAYETGAREPGSQPSHRAINDAMGLVGAGAFARKKVKALSGGERQRVAAARAIVRQPEILIADEPTGGLDKEHTWALMDLFQKLHLRGATVVLATHDREIVRRARRRSCVLKSGRLMVEEGLCLF